MAKGIASFPEYWAWRNMILRCTNTRAKYYKLYGGRGITVCDRWLDSFRNFLMDVGFRTSDAHSLDRINNDGNYEPGNVRWATSTEQGHNRRLAKIYPMFSSVRHLAEHLGVPEESVSRQLRRCRTLETLLALPKSAFLVNAPLQGKGQPRGERIASSKLTEEKVRKIRELYAAGKGSLSTLGREFGVGHQCIHKIVSRKIWAHVD